MADNLPTPLTQNVKLLHEKLVATSLIVQRFQKKKEEVKSLTSQLEAAQKSIRIGKEEMEAVKFQLKFMANKQASEAEPNKKVACRSNAPIGCEILWDRFWGLRLELRILMVA